MSLPSLSTLPVINTLSKEMGFLFFSCLCSMWDLTSLTEDRTCAFCSGRTESWPLDCQGSTLKHFIIAAKTELLTTAKDTVKGILLPCVASLRPTPHPHIPESEHYLLYLAALARTTWTEGIPDSTHSYFVECPL